MKVNGTLMNYYFHCRRQCYLHGNRVNLEDNSENVRIGKAIHEEKAVGSSNSEIAIENIKLDKLTAVVFRSASIISRAFRPLRLSLRCCTQAESSAAEGTRYPAVCTALVHPL